VKAPTLALVALGSVGAVAWGAAGYLAAHTPVEACLQVALASALDLRPSAVTVGRARLELPATLVIERLSAGALAAERVELELDLWAAAGGRLRIERVHARALSSPLGQAAALEAASMHRRARVALRQVTVAPTVAALPVELPLSIQEIGVELSGAEPERLAFVGARAGELGAIAGTASRSPDGSWQLRAARQGLSASARFTPADGRLDGVVTVEDLPLAALPPLGGVDLQAASVRGTVAFRRQRGEAVELDTQLLVRELAIDDRRVARARIDHLAPELDGRLSFGRSELVAHDLRVALGALAATFDGTISPRSWWLRARLGSIACAELQGALPRALLPHLDGLLLDGNIGGELAVAFDRQRDPQPELAVDLNVGCRVRKDAPLADVAALGRVQPGPLSHFLVDGRSFPLTPANPSWRALDSLPAALVRTFVAAEDGHFFEHHGFDLQRIGHALQADLDAGRFDRGASTITQQVVKNLFLSGERSAARKLEEAVLTWRLEQVLPKRRILELYLNLAQLGPGVVGVQEAADRYFGKLPEELSVDEAAQLAALLPAPRRGMDDAWARRYRALVARLPPHQPLPAAAPVKLTRR
jgi:hypothetical protein